MTGTIKAVKIDKGYGFVRPDNGGKDLFFHVRALAADLPFDETLQEQRVAFDMEQGIRGPRAENVRAAD